MRKYEKVPSAELYNHQCHLTRHEERQSVKMSSVSLPTNCRPVMLVSNNNPKIAKKVQETITLGAFYHRVVSVGFYKPFPESLEVTLL